MGDKSSKEMLRHKQFGDKGGMASKFKWIHLSQIKPASPEWGCILDSVSPSKIILWNTCALPHRTPLPRRQQGTTNNRMTALL
jgi:hypothetical protein